MELETPKKFIFFFGVSVVLYFIRLLSGYRKFWPNLRATDTVIHQTTSSKNIACVAGPQFYGGLICNGNQAPHKTEGLPRRLQKISLTSLRHHLQ